MRLLMTELKYCNSNLDKVLSKAKQVYKIGTNKNHPLYIHCCDFEILEKAYLEYVTNIEAEEVAATNE